MSSLRESVECCSLSEVAAFQWTQVGHSATVFSAIISGADVFIIVANVARFISLSHPSAVRIQRRRNVGSVGRTSGCNTHTHTLTCVCVGKWGRSERGGQNENKKLKMEKPGWPQRRKVKMQHATCPMPLVSALSLPLSARTRSRSISLSLGLSRTCTGHVIYE